MIPIGNISMLTIIHNDVYFLLFFILKYLISFSNILMIRNFHNFDLFFNLLSLI